ncbi:MAG: hypothetical protein ACTH6S_14380 [Mesonia sp.]|jgi:DNA-directed RNA polymerase subunit RPC12/RpoP
MKMFDYNEYDHGSPFEFQTCLSCGRDFETNMSNNYSDSPEGEMKCGRCLSNWARLENYEDFENED